MSDAPAAKAAGLKSLPKVIGKPHTHKYDISNDKFAKEDTAFKAACDKVGIKPCARQASKWRNKKGLAYANGR